MKNTAEGDRKQLWRLKGWIEEQATVHKNFSTDFTITVQNENMGNIMYA